MDPLSITATVITLAGLVLRGLKQVKKIRDAPADIDRFLEAVSELQLVLLEMHKLLEGQKAANEAGSRSVDAGEESLLQLLHRTARHLGRLQSIADKAAPSGSGLSAGAYSRVAWLRSKSDSENILKELQSLKLSMSVVLTARSSLTLYQIQQRLGQNPSPHRESPSLPSQNDTDGTVQESSIIAKPEPINTFIENSRVVKTNCSRLCSCVCHKPLRLSSPAALRKVFGAWTIEGGLLSVPCDEKMCKRRRAAPIRLTYCAPNWILSSAFMMTITSTLAGPQLSLRTMRVLPRNAEIFRLVGTGDIEGVKRAFGAGTASIYDIDDQQWSLVHKAFLVGNTEMCSFLIDQGADINIVADNGSCVVHRAWVTQLTLPSLPAQTVSLNARVLSLTDVDELIESQQYTVFHKIVLGLSPLDLGQQLAASTASVDALDSNGMSPLWWASARGDVAAIEQLLAHGAACASVPPTTTATTTTAFGHGDPPHIAANPAVLVRLLRAGADLAVRDARGRTPLHVYCYKGPARGGNAALLETALRSGADPNARTPSGHAPLHYAAMYGIVEYVHILLRWGADADARRTSDGYTPLLDAVRHRRAGVVEVLLGAGEDSSSSGGSGNKKKTADCTVRSGRGETVLHIAARFADRAVLEVLTRARLRGLDVDAKDAFDMTARDYMAQRGEEGMGLVDALDDLCASIEEGRDEEG